MTDKEYGLPGFRDSEGNRKPQEHSYQYKDQPVNIRLIPPTVSEIEEYEDMGEDVGREKLQDVFDRHVLKPEVSDVGELTIDELKAYVQGIIDYAQDGNDLAVAARDELEDRATAGN